MPSHVRYGIIGVGAVSDFHHVPGIRIDPRASLTAICDPNDALLLQRARDEAHRFGLAYNRTRRSARTITSQLLDIPGVGAERRSRLLSRFGSLAGVKSASPAEIAEVKGLSNTLAARILEYLKGRQDG